MSSDAPSERHVPVIRRKPDKWARKKTARGKPKSLSRVVADNYLDLKELRSAFRPPDPLPLKERIRNMLHPPYIPFMVVLLTAVSFTLVLSYAKSWGRGPTETPTQTIYSELTPPTVDQNAGSDVAAADENGAEPRVEPVVLKNDETSYDVLTGPFASRSKAEKACAEFAAVKQDCLVVER